MPNNVIKSYSKKTGKSESELEKKWAKAEKIAKDNGQKGNYPYIMGIFKRMLDIKEDFMYKVLKYL